MDSASADISNASGLHYAHLMMSASKCHRNLWVPMMLAIFLLSGSCSFWLDRPLGSFENAGPGARTLAEVYSTLDSLFVQYPDKIILKTIGFGASADFPADFTDDFPAEVTDGDPTGRATGDPTLPIRLAVWRDTAVPQPPWGLLPIRITAAIHGDEELGTELVLALLEKACQENPPELAGLELHVVPVANPYGYQFSTRGNYHGVNLNRNFPCFWGYESAQGSEALDQLESQALAEHAGSVPFVLSLSLHTGAYRIVMPWDYLGTSNPPSLVDSSGVYDPGYSEAEYLSLYSPAHGFLEDQASVFARRVENLFPELGGFPVSQGFDWYFAGGTETDYLYMKLGVPAYTVELSPYKYWKSRSGAEREFLVEGHLNALLAMLAGSSQGIHGRISGVPDFGIETRVNAVKLVVETGDARTLSRPKPEPYTSFGLVSASDGSFHIPLGAGTYQLTVVRDGVELAESSARVDPGAGTNTEICITAQ